MISRRAFVLGAPLAIAGCGAQSVWAPDDLVARNIYRHDGPPRITLMTMKSIDGDQGAHSALIINASQRVIWDPAGTFGHPSIPERNDVIFGATPRVLEFYTSYHSRETFYTTIMDLYVSADVAEMALRAVMANGAVSKAHCSVSTSKILRSLPGFESIRVTYFPNNLEERFGALPGVRAYDHYEDDADDKSVAAAEIDAAIRAEQ